MHPEKIFIIGLPRTGSTLLRSILNRSEEISIAAETHFLTQWARMGRQKRLSRYETPEGQLNTDALVADIFSTVRASRKDFWAWLNRNMTPEEFHSRLAGTDLSDRQIFELLIEVYAQKKKGGLHPGMVLGEKTAGNIYYVPTLMAWYPQAKLIHTFRDPRGIFVSAVKLARAGKWGVQNRLKVLPQSMLNPAMEVSMAVYILRYWLDATRFHSRYAQQYPGQYSLLRFEDLIADPELHIRRSCDFLGVPFNPDMISEVRQVGSSFTAQRVIPGGFEKQVVDRWKDHIHPWTRVYLTTVGRRQLKEFGYVP